MADRPGQMAVAVTVEAVVLALSGDALSALVVRRRAEPYRGRLALPGGPVLPDEDLRAAAVRAADEAAGPGAAAARVEQLGAYGRPGRDPRMRAVSVAYLAVLAGAADPGGGEAADAAWRPVAWLLARPGRLAFDHRDIVRDAVERARARLEHTAIGTSFCPPSFTVADLRRVYEAVWGVRLDPGNFHRKVTGVPGFVEPTGEAVAGGTGRPAQLYRPGGNDELHPALTRKSLT